MISTLNVQLYVTVWTSSGKVNFFTTCSYTSAFARLLRAIKCVILQKNLAPVIMINIYPLDGIAKDFKFRSVFNAFYLQSW